MGMTESVPLPWQAEPWQILLQRLETGRLHHALLLSGPRGVGKRWLAELLAKAILCDRRERGGACGRCRSCRMVEGGAHPDLLRVTLEEDAKQIKIGQIRELGEFVYRTAGTGQGKVILIDPAEAMNVNAANSLLKSLEEPAPRTYLLLVSDAPSRLLPTVRSRCEQLRFAPPATDMALEWLAQRSGVDMRDALAAAGGAPLAALAIVEEDGFEHLDRVAKVLLAATQAHAWVTPLVAEWNDLALTDLLRWVCLFLLDAARESASGNRNGARLNLVAELRGRICALVPAAHLHRSLERAVAALREAQSGANPNRQLMLEALLLDWQSGCADGVSTRHGSSAR